MGHFMVLAWLLLFSTVGQAETLLNGVASYQYLGKEKFIAALHTERLTSQSAEALSADHHRQMELRVVERFSGRRHVRTWIETAAINNSAVVLKEFAQPMVDFTEIINFTLRAGDRLLLDAPPGGPINVVFNGIKIGEIEEIGLFNVLLKTWIGSVPLSSTFRDDLLADGQVNADTIGRFNQLTPTEERIAYANSRNQPKPEVAQAAAQPAPKPPAEQPQQAAAPTVAVTPKIEAPKIEVAKPEIIAAPIAKPATQEPAPSSGSTNAVAQSSNPASSEPARRPETPPATQVAAAKPVFDEEEEDEDEQLSGPLNVDTLLQQQLYHSQLRGWAYNKVKYPSRSIERNEQGRVTLQVAINQSGKLLEVETLDGSGYRSLDRAAERAIKSASPFPEPPMNLNGEPFVFTVPIEFRLQ